MSKKTILLATLAGAATLVAGTIITKKEQLNLEDKEKIEKSKEYLESKGYVVVSKKNYAAKRLNLLSVTAIPTYYKAAKTIAKFVL